MEMVSLDAQHQILWLANVHIAQPSTNPRFREITAAPLRPPEVYIGGPWNEKVDIWTFGCLVSYIFVRLESRLTIMPTPSVSADFRDCGWEASFPVQAKSNV